ncbi:MAG: hypothetical protein KIH67_004320 [Candidatus Moranbacteria bacterium]|nr:hypothetical protein [Candidatus Moranbacteria bacterium]
MEPKFLPQFEKPETETPSFPEEMYAVSGFLSPNSKHYKKSQRFDTEIKQHKKESFRKPQSVSDQSMLDNKEKAMSPRFSEEELSLLTKIYTAASLSSDEQIALLRTALTSDNATLKQEALQSPTLLHAIPLEEQLAFLKDPLFARLIIAPKLYLNYPELKNTRFGRKEFMKSGSKTTLLGGTLQEKLILRHMTPQTFLAWKKAFEGHTTWQELGFDYVPIEPIQSYRLNKDHLIDVASGVLDINMYDWEQLYPSLFEKEILLMEEKILEGLEQLNIDHGHPHEGNFVLRFFRKPDGVPDFTKAPRLYLIDFDQATS